MILTRRRSCAAFNWQTRFLCKAILCNEFHGRYRHKETGEVFREHAGRYYDGSNRPVEENRLPKKFQLELIGTESEDRLDKKICPWDAIKMYEFDEGAELSTNFYEPRFIDSVNGVYVMNAAEKQRLEEKQLELYRLAE